MTKGIEKLYFSLLGGVLLPTFFLMNSYDNPDLAFYTEPVMEQIEQAVQMALGDESLLAEFKEVYDGVAAFYNVSADTTLAALDYEAPVDHYAINLDIAYDYYRYDKLSGSVLGTSWEEETVQLVLAEDIIFEDPEIADDVHPSYGTIEYDELNALNSEELPWVTIKDNVTGDYYCVAVFAGEINQYDGKCKYDRMIRQQ